MTEEQTNALAAAADTAEATAALIRFAREGEFLPGTAFDVEVVTHLADALRTVLAIELARRTEDVVEGQVAEWDSAFALNAELGKFLELWA